MPNMIYLIGISVTFFLAVLLIGEKNKSRSNHILTAWLVTIGVHLTAYYALASEAYLSFPYYLGFELPLPFVHGPFLYLYTCSLTDPPARQAKPWPHFIPFLANYVVLIPFLLLPVADKIYVYQHKGEGYTHITAVTGIAIMISGVTYVVLSLLKLNRYKKYIRDRFSDIEKINLAWLRYLILGISVIWVFVILGKDPLVYAAATLFVLFIGYFGIKQVGILARTPVYGPPEETDDPEEQGPDSDDMPPPDDAPLSERYKYEKSGLKDEQIGALHRQLTALMQEEKVYTNPEVTLSDLARELDIHPNYLSQLINSVEQKNFYDFINEHRVAEFKHLVTLPENQHYTLLTLAFECGFNSKTSFNRNFKKATGMTPSTYLDRLNIHLEE